MPELPSLTEPAQRDVLSVTDLNRKARQLLETHLPLLWVEGEISNAAMPSSGHWYFTLKDADAQVRCAMFKNRNQLVRFKPKQGQQVLVRARVSLYEGRGDYQLIVEHMEEAGFGVLQRAFEALKAKLEKEGLFAPEQKQPLPAMPKHLAVVTSATGAAIRDVLSVLARRFPLLPVTILPVAVQGEGSAKQIVDAIALANRLPEFDLILLTRGGGSLEDLWPFNEEIVARAIFASRLPIVSAVGHEVDFTISDFVADLRAPTPSAAAELISPDGDDLLETFCQFEFTLGDIVLRQIERLKHNAASLRARLRHPGERLQSRAQHLDNLELRLNKAMQFSLHQQRSRLQHVALRQSHLHPGSQLKFFRDLLQQLQARARRATQQGLQAKQQQLAKWVDVLDSVSPLNTLARGYSVITNRKGDLVRSAKQVAVGEALVAKLSQGELHCTVQSIPAEGKNS